MNASLGRITKHKIEFDDHKLNYHFKLTKLEKIITISTHFDIVLALRFLSRSYAAKVGFDYVEIIGYKKNTRWKNRDSL